MKDEHLIKLLKTLHRYRLFLDAAQKIGIEIAGSYNDVDIFGDVEEVILDALGVPSDNSKALNFDFKHPDIFVRDCYAQPIFDLTKKAKIDDSDCQKCLKEIRAML